ncbi:MAG TPA: SDR family oxidoreductase, partial [Candidatus Marinimicrobia bacterium]|nr:SDR family oxidoreductase [Candidatus Neomarinimicrobiota bacterium]
MFKSDLLKNKTIIITGGGTGLGKSMAMRFGELGANLVLTSRRQEVLDGAAQEINDKTGAEILTVPTDIRHSDQVGEMVNKAVDKFGNIDGLLNNAAGNFISPTENLSENAFRTIIDIVLVGTFNCTQAAGKAMKESDGGVILNIVTTYAFTGSGYVVPSACAKGGVLAMTRSLAVEWAKYGIRTNAIAPGPFPTKGAWKRLVPPGLNIEKKMMERVPLKRFGEHEELANLASYLMADESGYMNGEV